MRKLFTRTLLLCAILFCTKMSFAQLNYQPGGFTTSASTYTDIAATGTTVTMTNNDSGRSAMITLPFTFNFNAHAYTTAYMYVDGFIKLGNGQSDSAANANNLLFTAFNQPPYGGPFNNSTSTGYNPTASAQDTSLLIPMGSDMWGANTFNSITGLTNFNAVTPSFTYTTTGTVGSRIMTFQWKNLSDKNLFIVVQGSGPRADSCQYDTINFQVKLYEGTNAVEFVYGKWVGSKQPSDAHFAACGIKGNNNASLAEELTVTKGSTAAWSSPTINSQSLGVPLGNYNTTTSNALNYGNANGVARTAPDLGRVYHFNPVVFNDVAVTNVYAQGKIALPFYVPDSIRAYVTNPGVNPQSSITVVLKISGANSYTAFATIASLASQATIQVAFAPFTPTILGNNIIKVYTFPDDNILNDTSTYGFEVTSRNMAWTDTTMGISQSFASTTPIAYLNYFYVPGTAMISQAKAFIASNSQALADTVFGIITDLNGNILGRSPNYIIQSADIGNYVTFNITNPPVLKNSYFLSGIACGNTVNPSAPGTGSFFYLSSQQFENPQRTFYSTDFYQSLNYTIAGPANLANANVGTSFGLPTANSFANARLMMECSVDPDSADVSVISSTLVPTSIPTGTALSFKATVKNIGSNFRASGIGVKYSLDGGTAVGPVNTTIGLNQGDTTSVFFTGANALTISTAGTHTLKIFSVLANDQLHYSDTLTLTLTAAAPIPITISSPYRIAGNVLGTWTALNNSGSIWKTSAASIVQPNGVSTTGSLLMDNGNVPLIYDSKVVSPVFSFATILHPVMNFYVAHAPNSPKDDSLQVMVSTDNGITYTALYTKSSLSTTNVLGTVTGSASLYTPAAALDWRHEAIDLSAYAGNGNVTIAFRGKSATGNSVYISDIIVTNASSVSTQNVISTGTYVSGIMTVNFATAIGNSNGKLSIARYMSVPFSSASPVYATNTTATTNTSNIFTPNNVSPDNWWTITYSGIGTGNLPSTVPYSLMINISGIGGMPHPDSLYIMKRSENNGSWTAISTTRSGTILLSASITGFSDFAIGSQSSMNALPVKWLNITATRSVNDVIVNWSTATEINNDHFSVERSVNNIDFVSAGEVQSAGNSATELSYSFTDRNAMAISGTLYYRIRQYNRDGSSSVSKVVTVNMNAAMIPVSIYPNPFTKDLVLNVGAGSQDVKVVVMDINGREVYSNIFHSDASNPNIKLQDLNTLDRGFYMMNVTIDGNTQCLKMNKAE